MYNHLKISKLTDNYLETTNSMIRKLEYLMNHNSFDIDIFDKDNYKLFVDDDKFEKYISVLANLLEEVIRRENKF